MMAYRLQGAVAGAKPRQASVPRRLGEHLGVPRALRGAACLGACGRPALLSSALRAKPLQASQARSKPRLVSREGASHGASLTPAPPAPPPILRRPAAPRACLRTGPPTPSADLAKHVELLRGSRRVAGVNGAEGDRLADKAWISVWQEEAGGGPADPSEPPCCAVEGCHRPAVRAAHVWLQGGTDGTCICFCQDYCYVLPVCRDHSARRYNLPRNGRQAGAAEPAAPAEAGDTTAAAGAAGACGFRTKPGTRALRIRPHECYEDLRPPRCSPATPGIVPYPRRFARPAGAR